MKYFREVEAAFKGRPDHEWRMLELLRYVDLGYSKIRDRHRKKAMRVAVYRIVDVMTEMGYLIRKPPRGAGSYATYRLSQKKCYMKSSESAT